MMVNKLPLIGSRQSYSLLISFYQLLTIFDTVSAFCYPGCECSDEIKSVRCEAAASITSIPITFNPMLRSLTLRHAQSLKLDAVSLSLYPELEYLDLSYNAITELPSGLFAGTEKLRQVRLNNNQLRKLSSGVFGTAASNIEVLDISSNQLEEVHSAAFSPLNSSLAHLNLSGNRLQISDSGSWGPIFGALGKLEKLDLSRNGLRNLPSFATDTPGNLRVLDLSSNTISSISGRSFNGLGSLKVLNVSSNMISELSTTSAPSWKHLHELEELDLSSNPILMLSNSSFNGLTKLKHLRMIRMGLLEQIEPYVFHELRSLEKLEITHCLLLRSIHSKAFGQMVPARLEHLDLSHNHLSTLHRDMLSWHRLKYLDLRGNQWSCDCQILEFLPSVLNKRASGNVRTEEVYCSMPESLIGVRLTDVKDVSLCAIPLDSQTFVLIGLALASLVIAILLVASLFCVCRNRIGVGEYFCWKSSPNSTKSRLPLYATGSSFSESLIYEKQAEADARHLQPQLPPRLAAHSVVEQQPDNGRFAYAYPSSAAMGLDTAMGMTGENASEYYASILLPPHPCQRAASTLQLGCRECGHGTLHPPMNHTLTAAPCPSGQVACSPYVPYMLRKTHLVAPPPRSRSSSCSRPPSFHAPPPPPSAPPPPFCYTLHLHRAPLPLAAEYNTVERTQLGTFTTLRNGHREQPFFTPAEV